METVLTDEEISQFTIDEFWSEIEEGYREIEKENTSHKKNQMKQQQKL